MDSATFSQTYWYIWFLVSLFIVMLIVVNVGGVLLYRKKRQAFLRNLNQTNNNNIPLRASSTISSMNATKPKYRPMSVLSTMTRDSTYTNSKVHPSPYPTKSEGKVNSIPSINTIHETMTTTQSKLSFLSNENKEKGEMDLALEEFQRQALQEHNAVRAMHKKPPLELTESLNIYAQFWAEQCARTNIVKPSRSEWRLHCKGQPLGENILSVKSTDAFDGSYFTLLLMANGNLSKEVDCILNEVSTEVGFGRAQSHPYDDTQQPQWIGVAHYYPYRQLTTVQS